MAARAVARSLEGAYNRRPEEEMEILLILALALGWCSTSEAEELFCENCEAPDVAAAHGTGGAGGSGGSKPGHGGADGHGGAGEGAGGYGGHGGSDSVTPECATPFDCPGVDEFCHYRTCVDDKCGFAATPGNVDIPEQVDGDCQVLRCDGAGGVRAVFSRGDIDRDNNPCTADECTPDGPIHVPHPPTYICGGSCDQEPCHCDGMGTCVHGAP